MLGSEKKPSLAVHALIPALWKQRQVDYGFEVAWTPDLKKKKLRAEGWVGYVLVKVSISMKRHHEHSNI